MNRFFVDKEINNEIVISGEDYKHAKKVLRLNSKDNKEFVAAINEDRGDYFTLEIKKETGIDREPDVYIHIYQCLPKSNKMDFIIQKNVELGIKKITPITSNRSLIKIKNKKKEIRKLDRWSKISEEAAKQSMRNIIPEIDKVLSFKEMIDEIKKQKEEQEIEVVVPYENEEFKSVEEINFQKKNFALIVGPEGGFEDYEINQLIEIGAFPVTLGPRILRSETAALTLSTVILYETGNMRRK
jgi:16S rRNA (uracil1498-N3)-methyltransferase